MVWVRRIAWLLFAIVSLAFGWLAFLTFWLINGWATVSDCPDLELCASAQDAFQSQGFALIQAYALVFSAATVLAVGLAWSRAAATALVRLCAAVIALSLAMTPFTHPAHVLWMPAIGLLPLQGLSVLRRRGLPSRKAGTPGPPGGRHLGALQPGPPGKYLPDRYSLEPSSTRPTS